MTAKSKSLLPGHRVSVRGAPVSTGKWIQDTYIALAAGDVLTVTRAGDVPPPVEPPPVDPPPVDPPPTASRFVTSIPDLLTALADNTLDEIVVKNGTYRVSSAGAQVANSLWIGAKFAARTRPILVRAETPGGVILDGGGSSQMVWMWFQNGAHDQTWDGFTIANGKATNTGAIFFGERGPAPRNITIRRPKVLASIKDSTPGLQNDHAFYYGKDCHHITVEDFDVDGRDGGVDSAFHFYSAPGATDILVRRGIVRGTSRGILMGEASNARVVFEDVRIEGATKHAVEYWAGQVTFRRVTSTGSGSTPFQAYGGLGAVTQESCSWQ